MYFKKLLLLLVILSFSNTALAKTYSVGVLVYDLKDPFIAKVSKNIQSCFSDFSTTIVNDAKKNQHEQLEQLRRMISRKVDLILVNLVNPATASNIVNTAKKANIPLIFFNVDPDSDLLTRNNIYFVGSKVLQAGILQGEMIKKLWESGKYDKNKDGKFQYVMVTGPVDNVEALGRTQYSLLTAYEKGVMLEQVGYNLVANWERGFAADNFKSIVEMYLDQIEIIISNNDNMALGVIDVLEDYDYNTGDSSRFIPVIGVDAIDDAIDAIKNKQMSGTVMQSANKMANTLEMLAKNILEGKPALEDTNLETDGDSTSVRIDYELIDDGYFQ